jgi:uncharacterized protein YdeI (BOF family)
VVTSIADLVPGDGIIQTISGTVESVREDEFVLRDDTGEILVDAIRGPSEGRTLDLRIGERVTVVGDLDDEDFDATSVIRADGSVVIGQPNQPETPSPSPDNSGGDGITSIAEIVPGDDIIQTISGTVVSVDEDEFILRDNTGQVLVDGVRGPGGQLDIAIGERLTVVGDLDDEDFDAQRITRADGSVVISQPSQPETPPLFPENPNRGEGGPPPWAEIPGDGDRGGVGGPPPWAGGRGGSDDSFGGPPPWAGGSGGRFNESSEAALDI